MSGVKQAWVRIIPWDKNMATSALEAGADALVVNDEDTARVRELGVVEVVSPSGDIQPDRDVVETDINGQGDEARIVDLARSKKVIVRTSDWTIIPLENLVAQTGNLYTTARSVDEVRTHLGILEKGVDGVVIESSDAQQVRDMLGAVKGTAATTVLSRAAIKAVRPLGMGDRVCVDTCTMMSLGEGMLVGSSSAAMFLVHSETVDNPYVEPRPFRVNAGPVHAYIRVPGERTQYLSELKSGDEILIADAQGNLKSSVVGRIKRERRPLLQVEAECEGKIISVILQNAETVRLTTPDARPVSVVELRPGDEVLVAIEAAGRHFGHKVEETIDEI
jgi:3-dehydroquinate synthase II